MAMYIAMYYKFELKFSSEIHVSILILPRNVMKFLLTYIQYARNAYKKVQRLQYLVYRKASRRSRMQFTSLYHEIYRQFGTLKASAS